jgi:hypothetical protein
MIWETLLSPQVLFVYGPIGAIAIFEGIALYYIWSKHEDLHQHRLEDVQKMKDEYLSLVQSVEKTLDLLISVLSKRGEK